MARYVDADSVIEFAKSLNFKDEFAFDYLKKLLDSEPTANVRPIVYGEWKLDKVGKNGDNIYHCSRCKHYDKINVNIDAKYCWNCGAIMLGKS